MSGGVVGTRPEVWGHGDGNAGGGTKRRWDRITRTEMDRFGRARLGLATRSKSPGHGHLITESCAHLLKGTSRFESGPLTP